jgi:ubiquinone/menaquinone biosynthesis C-methylase UbiE
MNYTENYRIHLKNLISTHGEVEAMRLIVGGEFDAVGVLEASVLSTLGTSPSAAILDVGCGTGRLATALRDRHPGPYVGTDILPEMLSYADRKAGRKDWKFIECAAPPLPLPEKSFDVVCLFSVFTHLQDEDVFMYLKEISRLLRPEGIVVFSYLDFTVRSHWTVFEGMLLDKSRTVLNRFTSKDTLRILAEAAGMQDVEFWDGDHPAVQLIQPIHFSDGRTQSGKVGFGQSLCICRAPGAMGR